MKLNNTTEATMTTDEAKELHLLPSEVKKDIELAIANFKIWLLITVLSNVMLIGVPALYVFFSTTNTASTALQMALNDRERLDARAVWIAQTESRLQNMERHLHVTDQYVAPQPAPLPR